MDKRTLRKQILTKLIKLDPSALVEEFLRTQELVEESKVEIKQIVERSLNELKKEIPNLDKVLNSVKGATGEKGEKGDKGETGERGESIKGDKGERGEKGEKGDKGDRGARGEDGRDGKDAQVDVEKINSRISEVKDLIKQLNILTIEDVLKALKELKGNDRLDASIIKNLPSAQLPTITGKKKLDMSDMRWHGGGLSAAGIFTQSPSGTINSVNKVFTTTRAINNVITFNLNGQYIHPSEYSFVGQTITFVTAPDITLAGTSFSITFV